MASIDEETVHKVQERGFCPDVEAVSKVLPLRASGSAVLATIYWPNTEWPENVESLGDQLYVQRDGVFYGDSEDKRSEWICDLFVVLGTGEHPRTGTSTLVIRFLADGRPKTIEVPREVIALGEKTLAAYLAKHGLNVSTTKTARGDLQRLLTCLKGPRLLISGRSGWVSDHGKLLFILPTGETIGDAGTYRVHFDASQVREVNVRRSGTLAQWQSEVASIVPGNSRLVLGLSLAFASPLLRFAGGVQPTIINLVGETSRGKSLVGFLMGSAWGGGDQRLHFSQSWDQTDASIMKVAAAHTGIGLVLDEIHLCRNPGTVAYKFSQGVERGRLNSNSEQKTRETWSLLALSVGEKSHLEAAADNAQSEQVTSGSEVRCLDIDACPHKDAGDRRGVFERLHGRPSTLACAEAVEELVATQYGHAGPEFVSRLIAHIRSLGDGDEQKGALAFRAELKEFERSFITSLKQLPADVDPYVVRGARVFAVIAFAGVLAARFGVVTLAEEEMTKGVAACCNSWLSRRQSLQKTSASSAALVKLRDFVLKHRSAFVHESEHRSAGGVIGQAGYIKKIQGQDYFLIQAPAWKEITKSARRGELIKQLTSLRPYMLRSNEGDRGTYKDRIGGMLQRFYAVHNSIVLIDDNGNLQDGYKIGEEISIRSRPAKSFDVVAMRARVAQFEKAFGGTSEGTSHAI